MQSGARSLSFTASPVGEGKWYATREYHALNCLAATEGPIESSFGMLNATQTDQQSIYVHNTPTLRELRQPIFAVEGIPKSFLVFPTSTNDRLYRTYKNVFTSC